MVSVIIPIFNVEKELDRCIKSIVNQTYEDIEILLIDDGSTDSSKVLCEQWAKLDRRIECFSQINQGLGPTRNRGVSLSKGDFLMFVDSDDWIDKTTIEKMMEQQKKYNSDLVVCDRYDIKERTGEKRIISHRFDEVIIPKEDPDCIFKVLTTAWGKLYKRRLIVDNDLKEPSHYFEDAITPVIVALSNNISRVNDPLYYYVTDREGSIINKANALNDLIKYPEYVLREFKRRGLFDDFRESLYYLTQNRKGWSLNNSQRVLRNVYDNVEKMFNDFIEENWNDLIIDEKIRRQTYFAKRSLVYGWGSYNLMISAKIVMRMYGPTSPGQYNTFSSIIAAMDEDNGVMNNIVVDHSVPFRKSHLLKEIKRDFLHKNKGELLQIRYFLIDLLEERFDIGVYSNHYLTLSDAFLTMDENERYMLEKLNRLSAEVTDAWKKSCIKFIDHIHGICPNAKIIMVRMKLAEQYGNKEEKFFYENIEYIQKMNSLLDEYYNFFAENIDNLDQIEVASLENYYTDRNFKHGCYPWHLNAGIYEEISKKIEACMDENDILV